MAVAATTLLAGCGSGAGDSREGSSEYTLISESTVSLPLDSATSQEAYMLEHTADGRLMFYSRKTNSLCIYDLDSAKLIDKIEYYSQGPNAINSVEGCQYGAPDSVWLYSVRANHELIRTDTAGNILERFDYPFDPTASYAMRPEPYTSAPYKVSGPNHYLFGSCSFRDANPSQQPFAGSIFNVATGQLSVGIPYPESYTNVPQFIERFSGMLSPSYTVAPDGKIVVSFAASDSLFIFDSLTSMPTHRLATITEPLEITPAPDGASTLDAMTHLIKQPTMANILYDPENKLYYRLVALPMADFDPSKGYDELLRRPWTVVILDENFNKVGESPLPAASYIPQQAFVHNGALFLQTLSPDDDFMTFSTFTPAAAIKSSTR